jgi:hypothetical protein
MARRSSHHPHGSPRYLFSEAEDPSVLSGQFWTQLFRYRPLLLLGVFWLTLICISAVAYSRLMFSGVPVNSTASVPIQRSSPPPVIRPAPRDVNGSETPFTEPNPIETPQLISGEALTSTAADSSPAKSPGRGVSWKILAELGILVGLCALGSFIITQQAKRPPRPKAKKKKRKVAPKAVRKPHSPTKAASQPKRLAPFAPERDSVVVPGATTANRNTATNPPPSFLKTPDISKTHHPSESQHPPETHQPPESHNPDIVPDHEDHPLDWSEESIAHSLDLRHRRSLSSFM